MAHQPSHYNFAEQFNIDTATQLIPQNNYSNARGFSIANNMLTRPGPFGGGGGNNYSPPRPDGFGMNLETFNVAGNAIGGLGKLAQGWAAIKGLGIAEDQLVENQAQFAQNFGMQEKAYDANVVQANNDINNRNAWKAAQGRTDLSQLVA